MATWLQRHLWLIWIKQISKSTSMSRRVASKLPCTCVVWLKPCSDQIAKNYSNREARWITHSHQWSKSIPIAQIQGPVQQWVAARSLMQLLQLRIWSGWVCNNELTIHSSVKRCSNRWDRLTKKISSFIVTWEEEVAPYLHQETRIIATLHHKLLQKTIAVEASFCKNSSWTRVLSCRLAKSRSLRIQ